MNSRLDGPRKDPVYGIGQRRAHERRERTGPRDFTIVLAEACAHHASDAAEALRRLHVSGGIADHVGTRQFQAQFSGRSFVERSTRASCTRTAW